MAAARNDVAAAGTTVVTRGQSSLEVGHKLGARLNDIAEHWGLSRSELLRCGPVAILAGREPCAPTRHWRRRYGRTPHDSSLVEAAALPGPQTTPEMRRYARLRAVCEAQRVAASFNIVD